MAEETAFLSLRSGQALALAVTKRVISSRPAFGQ